MEVAITFRLRAFVRLLFGLEPSSNCSNLTKALSRNVIATSIYCSNHKIIVSVVSSPVSLTCNYTRIVLSTVGLDVLLSFSSSVLLAVDTCTLYTVCVLIALVHMVWNSAPSVLLHGHPKPSHMRCCLVTLSYVVFLCDLVPLIVV